MTSRRALLTAFAGAIAVPARAGAQATSLHPPPDVELRLLQRITNGLSAEEVANVFALGYDGYLDRQLAPEQLDDSACDARLAGYTTLNVPTPDLYALDGNTVTREVIESTILRAIYSKRQLFERMVEFWTDHFNTDINTVGVLKTADVRDVLRGNALATFPQMLNASAASPAMLNRLNTQQNTKSAPNQNYSRELMELHTLGVDGGFTQQDVIEVARCFTGWRYVTTSGDKARGTFLFNQNVHDTGTKMVLGNTITSAGVNEGYAVLRILADHPSTHAHVARKLLRWFVTYSPSDAQVADMATLFGQSSGDIKTVVRSLLSYGSLRDAPPLFKRPFHYVVSAIRALAGETSRYDSLRYTWLGGLGQIPFNWVPPNGYPHAFEYWSTLVLPRWNYAFSLPNGSVGGVTINTTTLLNGATTAEGIADRLNGLLFGGRMPAADKAALVTYLLPNPVTSSTKIRDAFGLALASPGFHWY